MYPRRILALLLLISTVALADGADWSRFRGPNGTGVSDEKSIPVQWDNSTTLWKVALPGLGNSSPIIWGDSLYIQTSTPTERQIICIDAKTGRTRWVKSAPGDQFKTIHKKNTHASETPAADAERVYASFWDGKDVTLSAFTHQGDLVWKQDLGSFKSQHGHGHSPIVFEGMVIISHDQDDKASIHAFDAKTGKPLWQIPRPAFRACYSTPLILDTTSGPQLLVGSTAGVAGYDPKTGKEIWNYTWSFTGMPLRTVGSPIVVDGVVLVPGGDGSGARHLIAVKLDNNKGDVTATHLAWEARNKETPYVPCLVPSGHYAFSVNDKGTAACYVARTGEVVWSHRLCGEVSASPVMIDGKVYAIDEGGDVYVFAAGKEFKLLAQNSLGEPVKASPAVADGRLYVRGKEHLFCIGKK
jgi:outer membrane protein assembly factor BamB